MKLPPFYSHTTLTILTVIFATLWIGSCFLPRIEERTLPYGYPTRMVVDTKQFERLEVNDSLTLVIIDAYFKALPDEMGLCIYGRYEDGTIVVTGLSADSVFPSRHRIQIFCTEAEEYDPIIGDIHSHPGASNPAYPCWASPQDYYGLLVANYGVSVIYCGNGSGVTIFRDGRWWNFAWR